MQLHQTSRFESVRGLFPHGILREFLVAPDAAGLSSFARPPLGRRKERRWGVVQPVGHHTVNVDGEGSNPSAPANFQNIRKLREGLSRLNTWRRQLLDVNFSSGSQRKSIHQDYFRGDAILRKGLLAVV